MTPFARRRALLATVGMLAALVLAACGGVDTAPAGGQEALVQEGTPLEHIHGLGIDPADGRLFIATHNGLFTAADGETKPTQVGDVTQDIMGFSVVGPNRFVGSGHPALDQDAPPHLGLIESRDGGKTWKNVSLLGEADFHVLEASRTKVYGFDGTQGRFMVSADGGRTWQQRTPPAGVFGLAIDPADNSRSIVATEEGLFVSKDEGRRWRPVNDSLAGLLAWPRRDALYLVAGDGQVLLSRDAGATWQTQGTIGGQPAAFIAHEDELYAALADGTVKRSVDGGATWTVRVVDGVGTRVVLRRDHPGLARRTVDVGNRRGHSKDASLGRGASPSTSPRASGRGRARGVADAGSCSTTTRTAPARWHQSGSLIGVSRNWSHFGATWATRGPSPSVKRPA